MVSFPYLLTILVSLSGSNSLVLGLRKICSLCNGPSGDLKGHRAERVSGEEITSMLALDEPCGVYTLPCAQGLRCIPLLGEQSPLQALLQGRGVCKNIKSTITDVPPPTGKMLSSHGTWILKLANLNKLNLKVELVDTRMKMHVTLNFEKCVAMIYKLYNYFCMCLRGKRNQKTSCKMLICILCAISRTYFFLKWQEYSTRYS